MEVSCSEEEMHLFLWVGEEISWVGEEILFLFFTVEDSASDSTFKVDL